MWRYVFIRSHQVSDLRILLNWTWIGQMMKCNRAIYFRRDKHHCSAGTHEQTTWGVSLSSLLEEETINSIDYAFNFQLEIRGPYLLAGQNISTQSSQTAALQSEKSARNQVLNCTQRASPFWERLKTTNYILSPEFDFNYTGWKERSCWFGWFVLVSQFSGLTWRMTFSLHV